MAKDTKSTREGGREAAEPLASGFPGGHFVPPPNRSGGASHAATILDLRVKLNFAYEMLERCFEALGDAEALAAVKRFRQTGFRDERRRK